MKYQLIMRNGAIMTQQFFPQVPGQPQGYPPQQPYPPQQYPQQPPQGFAQTYQQQQYAPPPQAPQQPLPNGTLTGFYGQPSTGSGPALKFDQPGQRYVVRVARKVTDADVRAQTNQQGVPQYYSDGRPKLVMVVPLVVEGHPGYPEGRGTWWVKGAARDELNRAMAEAGAPEGPPEEGAGMLIEMTGYRPIPNMSPQKLYAVQYVRPVHAQHVDPQTFDIAQQMGQQAPQQGAQQPQADPPAPAQAPAAPTPQAPAQPVQQNTEGMSESQRALLEQLTGRKG